MNDISPRNKQTSNQQYAVTATSQSGDIPLLRLWYRFASAEAVAESASFSLREAVRRSRIASVIIFGVICAALFFIPLLIVAAPSLLQLPLTITGTAIGIACCLAAIPFNRQRQISIVGLLLILAVNIIIGSVVLSEKQGLDPLFLSMFDLLVVSELIAALLLAPVSAFWIALLNVIEIILDINIQPRSMMWMQMIQSQQLTYSLLARPAILYFVVALVAFLWATSTTHALQRADRAEEIAKLEKREKERVEELEESIEQMLAVHMRVANGDFSARAPIYQSFLLWRVGAALNNLLSRFQAALVAERNLRNMTQEITQLRMALRTWRRGQPLQWYSGKDTTISPLVRDLQYLLAPPPPSSQRQELRPLNPITPLPPTFHLQNLQQRKAMENQE